MSKVIEVLLDGSGLEIPGRGTMTAFDGTGLDGAEMHETERGIEIGGGYVIPYSKCTYWRTEQESPAPKSRNGPAKPRRASLRAADAGEMLTQAARGALRGAAVGGGMKPQPRADGSGESVPARGKRDRK